MGNVEIPSWLEGLPLAPEFRPTDTEFADPMAYISKIEKEASKFGICKIIPPLPKPSKKYVFHNLNKSLLKRPELGSDVDMSRLSFVPRPGSGDVDNGGEFRAVFTTRQQELGQSIKKIKGAVTGPQLGAQKQVWQSGENYTLEQFESKSKAFAKSILNGVKEVSPMVIEALFWKAASEKPIYVDYANDVPGSAFGEHQETFRHFKRRRRRKASYWRSQDDSDCKKNDMDDVTRNLNDTAMGHTDVCTDDLTTSSSVTTNVTSQPSRKRNSSFSSEMEGTAGWKLSNSPWNLQVIARSPGSITRYMPDDIPGVTSPMVYVGMLFSWFAWHVEDHELHSMNFLHTGSQKTWYAVPGDYAFAFEEVIRTKAYGGDIDHLAALTLLGEKTTLLSPAVLVASGIPCCRLVQNPGDFVVTFPRAYHVGFSHGFNCGEAANFGTPQWLKVAKEAAVRRAAMNYLPMLSHQQLLYLLAMSFVFRVQRSLLPGARSSRLKDRLKEDRELLVKNAFIEDILNENHLLTSLVKESQYRAVLWHPDMLMSLYKEPYIPTVSDPAAAVPRESDFEHQLEKEDVQNDLHNGQDLYVESANDKDDDDLSQDFQIDSGSLACVACGLLGFPFMCVIQPCEGALKELQAAESLDSPPNQQFGDCNRNSVSGAIPSVSDVQPPELPMPSATSFVTGWDASNRFLRPRTFCLEHAVQVEKLMKPKGGANILVICHSDYERMKAHAVVIADEIGKPFNYNEIPLGSASQEELKLIDLAIGDEESDECGKDWTSKLGVNFRYCVKIRKESPSKQIKHALLLAGFSDRCPSPTFAYIKWNAKRSRSKTKSNCPAPHSPFVVSKRKEGNELERSSKGDIVRKEEIVFQYTRRKFKLKSRGSSGAKQVIIEFGEDQSNTQASRNIRMTDASATSTASVVAGQPVKSDCEEIGHVGKKSCPVNVVQDSLAQCNSLQHDVQALKDSGNEHPISRNSVLQHSATADPVEESFKEDHAAKGFAGNVSLSTELQRDSLAENESDLMRPASLIDFAHAATDLCNTVGSLGGIKEDNQAVNECKENLTPSIIQKNQPSPENPRSEIDGESCSAEPLFGDFASVNGAQKKILDAGESNDDENVSSCLTATTQPITVSVEESSDVQRKDQDGTESIHLDSTSKGVKERKRKREVGQHAEEKLDSSGFVRSPCEGLRPRARKDETSRMEDCRMIEDKPVLKKVNKSSQVSVCPSDKKENTRRSYKCDFENCHMSFKTKTELQMHQRNQCPHEGCRKKFRSHKYAVLHQRVHDDDRPLKCPWEGCSMSFKWAWARTEHIRVHTGERPYQCKVDGCGLSFRFVSDYSRHRRKTGHYLNSPV